MKFTEIQDIENQAASAETTVNRGYQSVMLAEYLEKEKRKSSAKENPFVYFYEDIILSSLNFDFQLAIGKPNYRNASDDALTCLNMCAEFRKLSGWNVSGWLNNALKFIDNIVLHYIQNICCEIPEKHQNSGIEKSRYIQLSLKKDKDISVAGSVLKDLYDLRNKLEHRTIIHSNGQQELIPPKRNKVRRIVVKLYPDALKRVLRVYKTTFEPHNNETDS